MANVVNSMKRLFTVFAILIGVATITVLLFEVFVTPVAEYVIISQIIGIFIIVAFWTTILLFIRRSKNLMERLIGEQAASILQALMAGIAVLIMVFAVLATLGVSPQSLLTGAGFASITIGLIVSTFVGGLLGGALVFTTHKLRVTSLEPSLN